MRTYVQRYVLLMLVVLPVASTAPGRLNAQQAPDSKTASQPSPSSNSAAADDPPEWLFPVAKFNESLPSWVRIGGAYRNRLEGPIGIGYAGTRDFYLLDRLRVRVKIQPKPWLLFNGELQDARIFFN